MYRRIFQLIEKEYIYILYWKSIKGKIRFKGVLVFQKKSFKEIKKKEKQKIKKICLQEEGVKSIKVKRGSTHHVSFIY